MDSELCSEGATYLTPMTGKDRYVLLDLLRSIALLGVIFVNAETLFRVSIFTHLVGLQPAESSTMNSAVEYFLTHFVEFKAFTLFAFLFGVGTGLQVERLQKQNNGGIHQFLARRFAVLLLIGLVHLFLIWNGDILTLYAVCGLVLLPLASISPWYQIALGALVLLTCSHWGLPWPSSGAMTAQAQAASVVYSGGTFFENRSMQLYETIHFISLLLISVFPKTCGLFLLGAGCWRSGFLQRANRWLNGALPQSWLVLSLAAVGRMALSNYLGASIILSMLFFYCRLFGKLGSAATALIALAIFLAQMFICRWWLSRYAFGPVEWLWRSLTYGRRQSWVL